MDRIEAIRGVPTRPKRFLTAFIQGTGDGIDVEVARMTLEGVEKVARSVFSFLNRTGYF
jgi:hypothetical protein